MPIKYDALERCSPEFMYPPFVLVASWAQWQLVAVALACTLCTVFVGCLD